MKSITLSIVPYKQLESNRKSVFLVKDTDHLKINEDVIVKEFSLSKRCFTGREQIRHITHILRNCHGVPDGYIMVTFRYIG